MIGRIRGVWNSLKKRLQEADAQDLVEYALLLMMVGLAVVASVKSLAASIEHALGLGTSEMVEIILPGNATGTVGAALAGNTGALNAAANVNAAAATVAAQAAAAEDAAAVAAAGGRNVNSASRTNTAAVQADLAAANADNVVATDDGLAALDDGAAGIAAAFGINNGPIGSTALTAAGNAAQADATRGVQAGTILGL
ncbi:MAG TPA: hypothetical protein VNZ56_08555 [Verrucomicrobiae bacterium]|jgi:hypothetical protein|nr:hypothetical protein [Verrucomicrobiae bacterium]